MQVITSSPTTRARPPLRVVPLSMLAGAALGVGYGVAIRAWMRLVAEEPEFSWSGTLAIIIGFTVTYALAGLVVGGRRRGWKAAMIPTRTVAIVVSLVCFGAAGLVMLPTIVLGALALARSDWPRWLRVVLAVVAAVSVRGAFAETAHLSAARLGLAIAIYFALIAVEICVFAEPYRPTVARLPTAVKAIAVAGAILGVGALVPAAVLVSA